MKKNFILSIILIISMIVSFVVMPNVVNAADGYVDVSTEANIITYATYGGKIRFN